MNWGELGAFFIFLIVFGTGIAALTVVLNVMFSKFVLQSRTTAERMPFRSGLVGLINLAFFTILCLAIFGIAQEAETSGSGFAGLLRLLGALILIVLCTFLAFGIAAIGRWVGERLAPDTSATRQALSGIIALELASLAPIVGWFVVPVLVLVVGYGAVIISLLWRRA